MVEGLAELLEYGVYVKFTSFMFSSCKKEMLNYNIQGDYYYYILLLYPNCKALSVVVALLLKAYIVVVGLLSLD